MTACIVPGCKSQASRTPNIKFHRFPDSQHEQKRFHQWIDQLQINQDAALRRNAAVCSLHFTKDDFSVNEMGKTIL
jgi:hypothetical protein